MNGASGTTEASDDEAAIRAAMQKFVEHMLRNTVNLVRVDQALAPQGVCSGVIVPKGEDLFVLSAYHGLKKGRYCLETNTVITAKGQTILLPLNGVFHTERLSLRPGTLDITAHEEIDFAWCRLDVDGARNALRAAADPEANQIHLPIYNGPLADQPQKNVPYGYAAWNRTKLIPLGTSVLQRESSYELNMEFLGTDAESGLYKFQLARDHQGRAYYDGASGAPIAEPTGKIVSLLIGGLLDENVLLGLPLAEYANYIGLGKKQ